MSYSAVAGSALGSIFGGIFGLGGAALQHKYNKELAEYQNQMNIEQWNRENEYNKPVNQMARLEEAGINPNLAYSSGGVSNTSASSPHLTAGSPADIQSSMSSFGSGAMQGLQLYLGLLNAQKINQENQGLAIQNDFKKVLLDRALSEYNLDFNTDFGGTSYALGKRSREFQKTDTAIESAKKNIEFMDSRLNLISKQTGLTSEQLNLLHQYGSRISEAQLKHFADQHNLDVKKVEKASVELKYFDQNLKASLDKLLTENNILSTWKESDAEYKNNILRNSSKASDLWWYPFVSSILGFLK